MSKNVKSVMCYWDIRGLGQPIRLMLEYVGEDYEDKLLVEMEEWTSVKYKLGLDFPNLPYYMDGYVKLSQTMAILRYIGNKHELAPLAGQERVRADLAAEQVTDLRNRFVMLCYGEDFDKKKEGYVKDLPRHLKELEVFLGGREWLAGGKKPSFVDFYAYEILDQHKVFDEKSFDDCPKLTAYLERFEALPRIQDYIKSDRFMAKPINHAPWAKWGGEK